MTAARYTDSTSSSAVRRPHAVPSVVQTVRRASIGGALAVAFLALSGACASPDAEPDGGTKSHAGKIDDIVTAFHDAGQFNGSVLVAENGLQPRLDEDGQLRPVGAALEWGIPVEPYLFVLDAEGRVFARFEGVVGGDERRAAIEDVLNAGGVRHGDGRDRDGREAHGR